jgi:hypothetical protein
MTDQHEQMTVWRIRNTKLTPQTMAFTIVNLDTFLGLSISRYCMAVLKRSMGDLIQAIWIL